LKVLAIEALAIEALAAEGKGDNDPGCKCTGYEADQQGRFGETIVTVAWAFLIIVVHSIHPLYAA